MFPKLFTQKSKPDIRSKTLPSTEYKYFAKNYFQMRKPSWSFLNTYSLNYASINFNYGSGCDNSERFRIFIWNLITCTTYKSGSRGAIIFHI